MKKVIVSKPTENASCGYDYTKMFTVVAVVVIAAIAIGMRPDAAESIFAGVITFFTAVVREPQ